MNGEQQYRSVRAGRLALRALISACFALLAGCGTLDRAAVAPPTAAPAMIQTAAASTPELSSAGVSATISVKTSPTPFPTFTPETPFSTAAAKTPVIVVTPAETPTGTATPRPAPTVGLPPTPAPPFGHALDQLAGDVVLYVNHHGFLMLTDGSQTLWLTSDETLCDRETRNWRQRGEWSSEGRFLAFTCGYAGAPTVVILDTQTGAFKRVDAGSGATNLDIAWQHAWSPTAAEFMIVVESNHGRELALVDAATGRLKQRSVLELGNLWSAIDWSPDGGRVAVLRILTHGVTPSPGIDPGLYIVDADGSNPHLVADVYVDGAILHSLDWSRDGRSIVVDESIEDGLRATLVSLDTVGEAPQPITNTLDIPTTFRWSPDGKHYLVKEWLLDAVGDTSSQVERKPYWSLYSIDRRLVRRYSSHLDRPIVDVAWMPDSQQVMMLVLDANGTAEVVMVDMSGQETVIAQFPNAAIDNLTIGRLAVAPRGALVAITVGVGSIKLLDTQGNLRAEVVGEIFGWRPQP
jgi:hypothetical protein